MKALAAFHAASHLESLHTPEKDLYEIIFK